MAHRSPDRAVLFIDGSNWFHAMGECSVPDRRLLDYSKISTKLIGPRDWIGTRYYIGQMTQDISPRLYSEQRSFLADIVGDDPRITVHFGRLETHDQINRAAVETLEYLHNMPTRIDRTVFQDLVSIARKHKRTLVTSEKAVDVNIAVDMVGMAHRDEYDACYLLSCDGDYTPAVKHTQELGKKVYVAVPGYGAALAQVADSFIRLDRPWFKDCYRSRA